MKDLKDLKDMLILVGVPVLFGMLMVAFVELLGGSLKPKHQSCQQHGWETKSTVINKPHKKIELICE